MNTQQNQSACQPKIVWVVSDGIAGHFNQSKGILLALDSQFNLEVHWLDLRLKRSFYRRMLSLLLNHFIPPIQYLSWFYQFNSLPVGQPDMVIGAGGKSAYAVAWLARAFQAKSIFSGSLRQLKSNLFDAILVLEPDLPPPFMSLQTSPMPINQQKLAEAAEAWWANHSSSKAKHWALLIGGDGAGAQYQPNDWQQLAEQLNALSEQYDVQWLISTSRRTGEVAEQILKQVVNPTFIDDAVWWSEEQRPAIAAFLGLSEVMFCTVDSMSMIMESVSAMRPVVVLEPAVFEPDDKYAAAIGRLEQQKRVQRLKFHHVAHHLAFSNLEIMTDEPSVKLGQRLAKLFNENSPSR
jgi:mitochondrial fission protein ELM1